MTNPPVTQDQGDQGGNSQQQTPTTYKVHFTVKDSENNNLSGVSITLTNTTDSTKTFTGTSSNGGVNITDVPAGTYSVTASHTDYDAPTTISNVTVSNADVEGGNIVMTAKTVEP